MKWRDGAQAGRPRLDGEEDDEGEDDGGEIGGEGGRTDGRTDGRTRGWTDSYQSGYFSSRQVEMNGPGGNFGRVMDNKLYMYLIAVQVLNYFRK